MAVSQRVQQGTDGPAGMFDIYQYFNACNDTFGYAADVLFDMVMQLIQEIVIQVVVRLIVNDCIVSRSCDINANVAM